MRGKHSTDIWRKVKVLVVDEISMVDAEFLDWYLSQVPHLAACSPPPPPLYTQVRHGLVICGDCMHIHTHTRTQHTHTHTHTQVPPGVQLVMCGDFMQLPPVPGNKF